MKLIFYLFLINIFKYNLISIIFGFLITLFVYKIFNTKPIKINKLSQKRNIKLSLLIPIYNEEANLETFIYDLYNNKNTYDVIMINDMSTDSSLDILKNNQKKYEYKIINRKDKNGFVAGVLNEGIKHIHHDSNFIGVINSDSTLSKNLIDNIFNILENNSIDVINLSNNPKSVNNIWQKIASFEKKFKNKLFVNVEASLNNGYFINKKVLKEVNYWDETDITEDLNLNLKIKEKGYIIRQSNLNIYDDTPDTLNKLLNQKYRWVKGDIVNRFRKKPVDLYEFIINIYYLFPLFTLFCLFTFNLIRNIFILQFLIIISESLIYYNFDSFNNIIEAIIYSLSQFLFHIYFFIRFSLDSENTW